MKKFLPLLFLLIILCENTQSQNLGFTIADQKKKIQIPIEIHNNLIVVRVILNDLLPLRFVVDTGVRTAILTQKTFSDILQLPYSRKMEISGPGGEKLIDAYITNNVSLAIPGLNSRGHALLVLEEDYLELKNYLGTDVHGILGYELFSRFVIKIDYAKKVMTLMTPEKFKPRKKDKEIPIRIEDTKPYIVTPVGLNTDTIMSAKLLVDTGASHGLMLDPDSDDRIVIPDSTVSSVIGRGLGGAITGKIGRIKSIQFSDYTIEDVLVNFPDPNSYIDTLKASDVFRNGSIGGEILSRFTVTFLYAQEKMYLRKNSSFKKGFFYNMSGINLKATGPRLNTFEISEVRKGSAGDKAGLLPGDRLITVNHVETHDLHLNQINGYFNSKPGKKVRMVVLRNGKKLVFEFRLENQI